MASCEPIQYMLRVAQTRHPTPHTLRTHCARFVTVSMTVGPASGVLKTKAQEEWTPREVALTVLIDRCAPGCIAKWFEGIAALAATAGAPAQAAISSACA